MFKSLISTLKDTNIRKRILFTLFALFIYKLGTTIPVAGVNTSSITFSALATPVFGLMNMISGGSFEKMSLFSLGVGPYITAGIIIQLLSMDVIPYLTELTKDGQKGRQQIEKITRYFTLVLAVIQGFSVVYGLDKQYGVLAESTFTNYLYIVLVMVAGTQLLIWLGDRISAHGIGNGISMIIFAGIVTNLPSTFMQAYSILINGETSGGLFNGVLQFVLFCIIYLLIVLGVVFVQMSERRLPIQYTSNIKADTNINYLPIKINSASVLPVIFAGSVLTAPQIIASFINYDVYQKLSDWLSLSKPFGLCLYLVLVFLFTFFYTDIQLNPEEMSKNLGKQNAHIPGIRPGSETLTYLKGVIHRVTLFGAVGLVVIAGIPHLLPIITNLSTTATLGGTGIIIVVGVAMELANQLRTQSEVTKYKGWFD